MVQEWTLGQGFRITEAKDVETDGQQAGEVPYHCDKPSDVPGSTKGRLGKKVGVKKEVNGYGPRCTQDPMELDPEKESTPYGHDEELPDYTKPRG